MPNWGRFIIGFLLLLSLNVSLGLSQKIPSSFRIARLKYAGGGDWYNDPSAVPNLMRFIREKTGVVTPEKEETVDASSPQIFQYAVLFMTGHGNIKFSESELANLRAYLNAGGFIYADDDYGMDKSFRREMKRLLPESPLVEIPYTHPIYNKFYKFPNGLPKIHEHDGKAPVGMGAFIGNRMVIFYSYESNPSDGWADIDVHNDSPEKREEAFRIGTNIILFAISY
ncbi:MAG: DUF4159 domain-containing protein [Chloroherpetonaceae bacterium]|nr:DUF4159 domain-containing protein [Chloroherpetonaceae bacterium]